ncbi:Hypothetical predicted protein [Cloeon dipterum]|uniref:Uncharacterized protein n=1 Tax=Cloeon dipterum TaxID=197152 RepID=A0A8S1DH75_9INSE|nr:Hypothetical predicted protein [Cloeon dipterum]
MEWGLIKVGITSQKIVVSCGTLPCASIKMALDEDEVKIVFDADEEVLNTIHTKCVFKFANGLEKIWRGREKPSKLTRNLAEAYELFFNKASDRCPVSKVYDHMNIERRKKYFPVSHVTYEISSNVSCGLVHNVASNGYVMSHFFIKSHERLVSFSDVNTNLQNSFFEATTDRFVAGKAFTSGGVKLKVSDDDYGNLWFTLTECELSDDDDDYNTSVKRPYRVVLSNTQFLAVRNIANNTIPQIDVWFQAMENAYNGVIRDVVASTMRRIKRCRYCRRKTHRTPACNCHLTPEVIIKRELKLIIKRNASRSRHYGHEVLYKNIAAVSDRIAENIEYELVGEGLFFDATSVNLPPPIRVCEYIKRNVTNDDQTLF